MSYNPEIKYCEHNRKGLLCYGLYGRFRVYICALDRRRGDHLLAGFPEPCTGGCTYGPPDYKRIYASISDIPLNEEAIHQRNEEREDKLVEAKECREEAESLLIKARELENE